MIVSCEKCSKRYLLDESVLGATERVLRCAACGHSWTHVPVVGHETLVATLSAKDPLSAGEGDVGVAVKKGYLSLSLLFAVFLSAIIMGGYFSRTQIVTAWPSALPLFQFLGINVHPSGQGLMIRGVHPLQTRVDAVTNRLVLTGQIVNTSGHVHGVPPLKIKAYGPCEEAPFFERMVKKVAGVFSQGKEGCVLVSWDHPLTETRLLPEEHIAFETPARELPKTVLRVELEF
ncbi:MAG: zinc-ribbon domain-containing protein [Alphaproteobacteria bacterium]|jgi:predicted Zn finger-like uncharacterized protein